MKTTKDKKHLKHSFDFKGLYAIIDQKAHAAYGYQKLLKNLLTDSECAVIQLRFKEKTADFFNLIEKFYTYKKDKNIKLIINDHTDIETKFKKKFDGFHVGQNELILKKEVAPHLLGITAHNIQEAKHAKECGADYLGCGAIFNTSTKKNANHLSLKTLSLITTQIHLPIVAIGGISQYNVFELKSSGCQMVAVASGLIENNQFVGQKIHERFLK